MSQTKPGTISLVAMLGWPALCGAATWAIGAAVLWFVSRTGALAAQAYAFALALAVMAMSSLVVARVVARSQAKSGGTSNLAYVISQAFTIIRMANVIVLLVLGLGMWVWLSLPKYDFFLWLAGFYMMMLFAQTLWLARKLKRVFRDSTGKMPPA
jgi:hypothetical protein